EDGIRDYKVTGVQTCALPISERTWTNTRPTPCPREGNPCMAARSRSRSRRPAPPHPTTNRSESPGHLTLAGFRDGRAMLPPPRSGATALATLREGDRGTAI